MTYDARRDGKHPPGYEPQHERVSRVPWTFISWTLAALLTSAGLLCYISYRVVSFVFWVFMLM